MECELSGDLLKPVPKLRRAQLIGQQFTQRRIVVDQQNGFACHVLPRHGQREVEDRAAVRHILGPDAPALRFDQAAAHEQAETITIRRL